MNKRALSIICILMFFGLQTGKAQYTILYNFNDTTGAGPVSGLVLLKDVLYGTTYLNNGTLYSIHTDGSGFTNFFTFNGTNGYAPDCLTPSVTGDTLFGSTNQGGSTYGFHVLGDGLIYSIRTDGTGYNALLNFVDTNGENPTGLTLSGNGDTLFGMTVYGGVHNLGRIYSIRTDGTGYHDMLDFDSTNGETPEGSLTLSVTGDSLFGMTPGGGANDKGCIFVIKTNGTGYKDLFDFSSAANCGGGGPFGSLTLFNGILYGMTGGGGTSYDGCVFSVHIDGTRFEDLYNFPSVPGGADPVGSLVISSGVLYGTTPLGGINHGGIIFSIDTNGKAYEELYDCPADSGDDPYLLTLSVTGDTLFGITEEGGPKGYGVVFRYKTSPTGINELSSNTTTVKLFPNPNDGSFTIEAPSNSPIRGENYLVEIYNMLGQQVASSNSSKGGAMNILPLGGKGWAINLSGQPVGIYFYRLVTENGELTATGKFIIE